MSELQATVEFAVEYCKFYNIDLFQRGWVESFEYLRIYTQSTFYIHEIYSKT